MQKKMHHKSIYLLILSFILISCDFTTAEQNFFSANEYADNKNYKKAISELDKAISKKQKYRRALFNRAIYKTEIKDISGAVKDYKKILSFKNCTECAFNLALILKEDKQYEKVLEILNEILTTNGVVKHNAFMNSNLQFFNDDNDSDYNVNEEYIYFEMGLVHLASKQYIKAIFNFEKTNDLNFYKNEGYYNIAEAYLGLKDTLKACGNYKYSEKLNNKNATERIKNICINY